MRAALRPRLGCASRKPVRRNRRRHKAYGRRKRRGRGSDLQPNCAALLTPIDAIGHGVERRDSTRCGSDRPN
ncbi:MAG: hypothetical protein ACJ797_07625 [Ktedonobacteraceae bacterium]